MKLSKQTDVQKSIDLLPELQKQIEAFKKMIKDNAFYIGWINTFSFHFVSKKVFIFFAEKYGVKNIKLDGAEIEIMIGDQEGAKVYIKTKFNIGIYNKYSKKS